MNKIEEDEFAQVADLLAPAKGEKEVLIKSLGKKVRIKKITIGELAAILKVARDNELEQYIWLVYKGLVKPKLTIEQAKALNHTVLLELALEISKFSELDKKSMERLENLLSARSS